MKQLRYMYIVKTLKQDETDQIFNMLVTKQRETKWNDETFIFFLAHLSSAQDELLWSLFVRCPSIRPSVRPCVRPLKFSNDFSSETAEPILLKFHMEPP